jgi:hypothetical protein
MAARTTNYHAPRKVDIRRHNGANLRWDPRSRASAVTGGYCPRLRGPRGSVYRPASGEVDDAIMEIPQGAAAFTLRRGANLEYHNEEAGNFTPVFGGFDYLPLPATTNAESLHNLEAALEGTQLERAAHTANIAMVGQSCTRLRPTDANTGHVIGRDEALALTGVMDLNLPVEDYRTGEKVHPQPGDMLALVAPHTGVHNQYANEPDRHGPTAVPVFNGQPDCSAALCTDILFSQLDTAAQVEPERVRQVVDSVPHLDAMVNALCGGLVDWSVNMPQHRFPGHVLSDLFANFVSGTNRDKDGYIGFTLAGPGQPSKYVFRNGTNSIRVPGEVVQVLEFSAEDVAKFPVLRYQVLRSFLLIMSYVLHEVVAMRVDARPPTLVAFAMLGPRALVQWVEAKVQCGTQMALMLVPNLIGATKICSADDGCVVVERGSQ